MKDHIPMIKNSLLTALLLLSVSSIFAKDGYHIELRLENTNDSIVYLAHYYGKPFPTIFKADSARINRKGIAIFNSKEKITGGIYLILPADRKTYFEFLLDNGDDLKMMADVKKNPVKWSIKKSPGNEDFIAYQDELIKYADKQEALKKKLEKAETSKDTANIKKESADLSKELYNYRRNYSQTHPNTLLAHVLDAIETPIVPEGKHYLPDGSQDTAFVYHYYKDHYWDLFDFDDDRLIHTPLLQQKLDEYFNKLVFPFEDSVIAEADKILEKIKGKENLFKFTLNWLSTNAQTSKVMGMDKVFVYLVENYYAHGDATWLTEEELNKYLKRAGEIAPSTIGSPAKNFIMHDDNNVDHALYDVKAKYTLLIFWSPDCGHCIHEMPLIDSLYRAELKAKGVKIYAAITENHEEKWKEFITKHHLEDWINVWDPKYTSGYWQWYDVKSTPTIYLLDENKIIRGKKLDHTTISKVIDMIEHKEKMSRK